MVVCVAWPRILGHDAKWGLVDLVSLNFDTIASGSRMTLRRQVEAAQRLGDRGEFDD